MSVSPRGNKQHSDENTVLILNVVLPGFACIVGPIRRSRQKAENTHLAEGLDIGTKIAPSHSLFKPCICEGRRGPVKKVRFGRKYRPGREPKSLSSSEVVEGGRRSEVSGENSTSKSEEYAGIRLGALKVQFIAKLAVYKRGGVLQAPTNFGCITKQRMTRANYYFQVAWHVNE
ncbi:hypothetical protein EDD85DRAFT_786187 [Armillaria nabsnona]|nr:hypothetical protein EDD85DRAFT_786187 [Armillaria nabsnona]